MSTLSAWKFPTVTGADAAERRLLDLHRKGFVTLHDAAIVWWDEGAKKPKTRQLNGISPGSGALGGSFWGFLFGLIFFMPLLGLAIGAATGALAGSLSGAGIDEKFIEGVQQKVTPGSSALFVLTTDGDRDRVAEEFTDVKAELLQTNLDAEQEDKLREAFA